jgi:hypothetical protein
MDIYAMSAKDIDGNEIGLKYGVIYIIKTGFTSNGEFITTAKCICLDCELDEFITLNDCLKEVDYKDGDSVMVIMEVENHGEIYAYGNYSKKVWNYRGDTVGFY